MARKRVAIADAPLFDDVGAIGDQGREMQVLLRQQDRQAFVFHLADGLRHLLDDDRRQPFRRLVSIRTAGVCPLRPLRLGTAATSSRPLVRSYRVVTLASTNTGDSSARSAQRTYGNWSSSNGSIIEFLSIDRGTKYL